MDDLNILYEDNHLIIVNKEAGDITQGDKTGDVTLPDKVKAYLKDKYNKPGNVFCGVIHRLDRPTSGVVVFAKTSKALSRMNEIFRDDHAKKTYWAIVENSPKDVEGVLTHYLVKNEKQNKSYAYSSPQKGAKEAILSYRLIDSSERYYLLEIDLKTGRHHQIRSQLAAIGVIIKGDLKYGAKRSNPNGSISLHARSIKFTHPISKELIIIIAPVPEDNLWSVFKDK